MRNDNSIAASATTTGNRTVNIGGNNYTGNLSVDAVFDDFAPYAGSAGEQAGAAAGDSTSTSAPSTSATPNSK